MRGGLGQRALLGLGKGGRVAVVQAAGIFAARAQGEGEELRRQLVMLGVGVVGVLGDRTRRHVGGEPALARRPAAAARRRLVFSTSNAMPSRVTASGSGSRSTASMVAETRLMAMARCCAWGAGREGKKALVRAW